MTEHDPAAELRERWQLRARLCAVEAERSALAQTVNKLVHDCRQNEERARKAHDRIDELIDMNTELAGRLKTAEDVLAKMREWLKKRFTKANGNAEVEDANNQRT